MKPRLIGRFDSFFSIEFVTDGTCSALSCSTDRGPTQCIDSQCHCAPGYYTNDGAQCIVLPQFENWNAWENPVGTPNPPSDAGATDTVIEHDTCLRRWGGGLFDNKCAARAASSSSLQNLVLLPANGLVPHLSGPPGATRQGGMLSKIGTPEHACASTGKF